MPDVMSFSWGGPGADPDEEAIYAALAAQGITVIASSGDAGAFEGSSVSNPCEASGIPLGKELCACACYGPSHLSGGGHHTPQHVTASRRP